MFCPKCSSLLKIKKEKNKKYFTCSCGYTSRDVESLQLKEEVKKDDSRVIGVVDENDDTLPLTEAECEKCKHNRAYYWLIQTRAGDEADTKFLRCEKCRHTWRDYG